MEIILHPKYLFALNKIKEFPFNRDKKEVVIKILMKGMVKDGVMRAPVVVKTKIITGKYEYYFVDGQHLSEAAKRLNITHLECFLFESESTSEIVNKMASLNNIGKKWTLFEYVNAFCGTGDENYFKLKNHAIVNGFSIAVSATILSGSAISGQGCNKIKYGTFVANAVNSDIITQNLLDISALVNTNSAKFHKAFLLFFKSIGNKYNHKKLIEKIKDNKKFINLPHDTGFIYDLMHKTYSEK